MAPIRDAGAVAHQLYCAIRRVVLALVFGAFLVVTGIVRLLQRVIRRLRRRTGEYLRAIVNAYRQGPFVLMLKILRRFPVALVSWIEVAYFALGRARDLTFDQTVARAVTVQMSGDDGALRNFYVSMARLLDGPEPNSGLQPSPPGDANIEDDAQGTGADRDPRRKSPPRQDIELNILLDAESADVGRIQNIAQMGRPAVKDFSVYFDEDSLRHDLPVWVSEPNLDPTEPSSSVETLNVDDIRPEHLLEHFTMGMGIRLVEPDTAIAHTGNVFTGLMAYSALVVVNLVEGGIRSLERDADGAHWTMIEMLRADEEMFADTIFVVINAALNEGTLATVSHNGNVVPSSALGLAYPDVVAMLDQADCYIGVYDYYGAAVPGRPLAALLFPPSSDSSFGAIPGECRTVDGARAIRGERPDQMLLLDHASPELVAGMVKRAVRNDWHWE